jgi:riboflavin synthase
MFTGLIQAVGRVAAVVPRGEGAGVRLVIDPGAWEHQPAVGDSISVSGVCLTVAGFGDGAGAGTGAGGKRAWCFDAIPETMAKTALGRLTVGSRVNLEHALTPSTLLGGHFVQGHVDGVGEVVKIQTGADWRVTVRLAPGLMMHMVPKGSICLDGVSLTIAELSRDTVTVALIPVTLDKTTLGDLRIGDGINVEADVLVKAVVATIDRVLAARGLGVHGLGASGG